MRRAALVAVLLGTLASGASARPGTTVVYPTGEYPSDVESVQAAVDQGGKVLLKATSAGGAPTAFDFGPPEPDSGFVTLEHDVELVGEHAGAASTTIEGGDYPVQSFAAIRTTVRDITFEAPLHGAILVWQPEADTEITGNRIAHVVGRATVCCGTVAEAIVVSGGRIVVSDNVVEDVAAETAIGISEFDAAGKVEILRNRVSGTSYGAIECSRNQGVVKILHNVLRPGPTSDGLGGFGIEVNGTGSYDISRNEILVETPGGIGIYALGIPEFGFGPLTDPVIERNHIAPDPSETSLESCSTTVSTSSARHQVRQYARTRSTGRATTHWACTTCRSIPSTRATSASTGSWTTTSPTFTLRSQMSSSTSPRTTTS
jgi:hypothetical protein